MISSDIITIIQQVSAAEGAAIMDGLVGVIFKALVGLLMLVVLFLPIIMVPYIFLKMGSVAGKVAGKMMSFGKNTAMGKGIAGAAAKRGVENKAAQWAARNDGSLRSKVGGYKPQRDFRREQNSAAAKRMQEHAVFDRVKSDPGYALRAAGVSGETGARRLQTRAEAHSTAVESKEAKERRDALTTQWQQGRAAPKDIKQALEHAYSSGDVDTAAAATTHLATAYGATGREMLETTFEGLGTVNSSPSPEMVNALENVVGNELYGSLVGKVGATAKGGFDSATDAQGNALKDANGNLVNAKFTLKPLSSLGTEQLATQDAKHLMKHFSSISTQDANDILTSPALESKIVDKYSRALLNVRNAGFTSVPADLADAINKGLEVPATYR